MSISPLLDSTIIFISNNQEVTRDLLHIIRRRNVSRNVHWLRTHEQVSRHFHNDLTISHYLHADQSVAIILDYDLQGVSAITRLLNESGILKTCTLFSLTSIYEEVDQLTAETFKFK